MILEHARGTVTLDRTQVMGIVNRTPDSFYDGGRMELGAAVDHALRLIDEGADMLDLGAVKAGPGPDVEEDEETRRLIPLVEALAGRTEIPLSVETGSPQVARRAFEHGAAILNDVTGLAEEGLAQVCAESGGGLVLMHHGSQLRGRPRHPRYKDVVADVIAWLESMGDRARSLGMRATSLINDPGLDFGKTTYHSLEIMRRLDEFAALEPPLLVAPSRKDVVGETLGLPLKDRLEGTLGLVALSAAAGAAIVRVHDVKESVRVARMVDAVRGRTVPIAPIRGLWD